MCGCESQRLIGKMNQAIQKILEEFAEYMLYGEENIKQRYQMQKIEKRPTTEGNNIESVYRHLAKMQNATYWGTAHKQDYYEQAKYIETVEDHYVTKRTEYKEEYYYYNDGSYPRFTLHNFRLYITWRTKVRKGIIEPTNDVFQKLYINETLNLINCQNEHDALDKLCAFWKAYRVFDSTIDYRFRNLIKEFYIGSSIEEPFEEIEKKFPSQASNTSQTIQEIQKGNYHNKLQWIHNLSQYKIASSKFLETPYGYMLEACLEQVLNRAHKEIAKVHLSLTKILVRKQTMQGYWNEPLIGYCVYRKEAQKELEKQISAIETYSYKKGIWKKSMYIANEIYKPFITYLVKNMEYYIRKYVGYRPLKKIEKEELLKYCDTYYYTPQQESNILKLYTIDWDAILKETIIAYLKTTKVPKDVCKTKKQEAEIQEEPPMQIEFHVDTFKAIREKAEQTQKSLIIEEEEVPMQEVAKTVIVEPKIEKQYENVYVQFIESLNTGEKEVVKQMIAKQHVQQTIEKVAVAYAMMPEMLLSQINDKALASIGDTIMDSGAEGIYEEYEAEMKQILG